MIIKNLRSDILFSKEGNKLAVGELDGMNLKEALLRGFDFQMITLDSVNMASADLREAIFYWCVLLDVNFQDAHLESADFKGATLARVNFRGANLRSADFSKNGLGGPSVINASDFTGADLSGAILTDARYDENTVFPEGFDAAEHGMTFKNSTGSI